VIPEAKHPRRDDPANAEAGDDDRQEASPSRESRPAELAATEPRKVSSTARALAMLSLLPVTEIPIPRVHVGGRQMNGAVRVFDRPSGESVVIYTPSFTQQFSSGHRAGRWYVRKPTHVGVVPRSLSFPTVKAAIKAVEAGRWALASAAPSRRDGRRTIRSWTFFDNPPDCPA
jgi:hypothetical protein